MSAIFWQQTAGISCLLTLAWGKPFIILNSAAHWLFGIIITSSWIITQCQLRYAPAPHDPDMNEQLQTICYTSYTIHDWSDWSSNWRLLTENMQVFKSGSCTVFSLWVPVRIQLSLWVLLMMALYTQPLSPLPVLRPWLGRRTFLGYFDSSAAPVSQTQISCGHGGVNIWMGG